ncbi:CAMK protein kinase [Blastomyces percursus]|uniref:CAMK protein kinase n=1 Tax=Blastomyces percursus TaxID=1658174 RepID=A0A1J9R1Z0_9EURO|nr:CAMK protein kinase [Blastomyces percursus]
MYPLRLLCGCQSRCRCGVYNEVRAHRQKISARHFRLYFNFESGSIILQNESQHGTQLHIQGVAEPVQLSGNASRALPATKSAEVIVGHVRFLLYHPTLSGNTDRAQHQMNWQAFTRKCKTAIPELGRLILSSEASTRPPSQRSGLRNGYTMLEEIGRGEYGIVPRAIECRSGAILAVKEYFRVKEKQEAKNLSEIATVQSLSHRHIVKFVDLIADQVGLALVMEFMPLGNPKDQHRQEKITRADVKIITQQVLEAVAYLHGVRHVHRDIKPENILLKQWDPPIAKVSDFGLAARDGFLTTECGTHKYAAPEIYKGQYDKSVDIWSLSASIFDIAEGLPDDLGEYSREDWPVELQRRVTATYFKKRDPFLGLLQRMLHRRPGARPSAEDCLSDSSLKPSPKDISDTGPPSVIDTVSLPTTVQGSDYVSPPQQTINAPTRGQELAGDNPESQQMLILPAQVNARVGETSAEVEVFSAEEYLWKGHLFKKLVINGTVVSLRVSDGWINFTRLAATVGKDKKWIDNKLKKVPRTQKEVFIRSIDERGSLVDPLVLNSLLRELGLQNNEPFLRFINIQGTNPEQSDSNVPLEGQINGPTWQKRHRSPANSPTLTTSGNGRQKRPHLSANMDVRTFGKQICLEDLATLTGKSHDWIDHVLRNVPCQFNDGRTFVRFDAVIPYMVVSVNQSGVSIEARKVWEYKGDTYYMFTLGLLVSSSGGQIIPRQNTGAPQFDEAQIKDDEKLIIVPARKLINVTNLLRFIRPKNIDRDLTQLGIDTAMILQGNPAEIQGRYVACRDFSRILDAFGLKGNNLLRVMMEAVGLSDEGADNLPYERRQMDEGRASNLYGNERLSETFNAEAGAPTEELEVPSQFPLINAHTPSFPPRIPSFINAFGLGFVSESESWLHALDEQ